jgi:hypothetical protein
MNSVQELTTTSPETGTKETRQESGPLLPHDYTEELRSRWESIQGDFVDEPRDAVRQADDLISETMKRLTDSFKDEKSKLEARWSRGDEVSTEDLRVAFRMYRSFFQRLLNI